MNGISDHSMSVGLTISVELGRCEERVTILVVDRDTALFIWRDTTGNDHADATSCALSIERRHAFEPIGHFF